MKLLSCIAVLALFAANASASETIRVAVADRQQTVVLKSTTDLEIEGSGNAGKRMVLEAGSLGTRPVRVRSADGFVQVNGRSFRGVIEVRHAGSGLLAVNDLDIEDYLLGVVAEEMPHDWEPEALKAQAVVARTFALYQKQSSGRRPYHIRSTVMGQVYSGKRGERPESSRAVQETRGLVLTYGGAVAATFFHSSCGGQTENALEVWNIDEPYLKGVDCDCQRISKYGVWERRFGLASIETALRKKGYRLSALSGVRNGSITPAGRVRDVEIVHHNGRSLVPAEQLRAAVGYSSIPSVFFEAEMSGADVIFFGRGMGHGVGMCQWGARAMALDGSDFGTILEHYYPGTRLGLLQE